MTSIPPTPPRRPLLWPPLVERLTEAAADASNLYLVGGVVRDALLGMPIHDIDLATPGDGLSAARQVADALGGAYYPVDPERHTGRAIVPDVDRSTAIDIATFREGDLLADLSARDFTINALAVRLDQPDLLIDPLGGQADLFDAKLLRQCNTASIASDPIRALRAVRHALRFRLHMAPETRDAARAAGPDLVDAEGNLAQPERSRDELFKMLGDPRPAAALRLLDALGLLNLLTPFDLPSDAEQAHRLTLAERIGDLLAIISPRRNDDLAADLLLGVAVMVLDRHRKALQEHFAHALSDERTRGMLLMLAALTPPDQPAAAWADRLRLSKHERRALAEVSAARGVAFLPINPVDPRQAYRYYRLAGESGVDGVLLALANYLAQRGVEAEPDEWGRLLDEVASPLLDAFFRHYQQIVAPPPLLTGHDLMKGLGLKAGPQVGALLDRLIEEQAAGTIRTKKEALRLAKRLNADSPSAH